MTRGFLLAVLVMAATVYTASAQDRLARQVIGSGGIIGAPAGGRVLSGTVGQVVIGIVNNTAAPGDRLSQGFWLPLLEAVSVDEGDPSSSTQTVSNFPNPFQSSTTIRFDAPLEGDVTVRVFDMVGNLVRSMTGQVALTGAQELLFDGLDTQGNPLASGGYIYEVTGTSALTGKAFNGVGRMQIVR